MTEWTDARNCQITLVTPPSFIAPRGGSSICLFGNGKATNFQPAIDMIMAEWPSEEITIYVNDDQPTDEDLGWVYAQASLADYIVLSLDEIGNGAWLALTAHFAPRDNVWILVDADMSETLRGFLDRISHHSIDSMESAVAEIVSLKTS